MKCPSCGLDNELAVENCFSCGRGLFALTRGSVLVERYEILKQLGRGGMGIVYQAHDRELDETVALKVLRSDIASSPDAARRFRHEIKLARRIRHPNVCAIHEYGQAGHLRFIVMEFVDGVDLKQAMHRQPVASPEAAAHIVIQVCDALEAIHNAGIVHRDLKAPNIMVDRSDRVRVMDFGIAKTLEADSGTRGTATGSIIGTPEYMSPEQVRAEKLDCRSDLYSLGIVMYELMTGEMPFKGDTPIQTMLMHVQARPSFDRIVDVARPFVPVLEKAMEKESQNRFQSAREFRDALTAALGDAPRASPHGPRLVAPVSGTGALALQPNLEPRADTDVRTAIPTQTRNGVVTEVVTVTPVRDSDAPARLPVARLEAIDTSRQSARQSRRYWAAGVIVVGAAGAWWASSAQAPGPTQAPPSATRSGAATANSATTPGIAPDAVEQNAVVSAPPRNLVTPLNESKPPRRQNPTIAKREMPGSIPTPVATTSIVRSASGVSESLAPAVVSDEPSPVVEVLGRGAIATPEPIVLAPSSAPSQATHTLSPPQPAAVTFKIKPWADVSVDGRALGRVAQVHLTPGAHQFVFTHPDYEPLRRMFHLKVAEPLVITIDMRDEGLRRKR